MTVKAENLKQSYLSLLVFFLYGKEKSNRSDKEVVRRLCKGLNSRRPDWGCSDRDPYPVFFAETCDLFRFMMLYTSPKIAIVVPCYNEGTRLPAADFMRAFEQFADISFCFVNDGSSDGTQRVLEDLSSNRNQVCVISLERNKGKAEAVRVGIKNVLSRHCFAFVGYWDADMATPFSEIPRFVEVLNERPSVQFVCGSRILRMGSRIERFWYRHYTGRIFATAASFVLGIPIYDTQCGAKFIKTELAKSIFNEPFMSTWLFDIELLARTIITLGKKQANQAIFELPLENWQDMGESKVTPYHYFVRAPCDLLRIFWYYRQIHGLL